MDQTERELREMLADHRLVRWPTEPQWKAIWLAANERDHTGGVSAAVSRVAPELLDPDWSGMLGVGAEEARMMWSEIRVRRSVSPFVEKKTPFTATQKAAAAAAQLRIDELTSQGWEVISNGQSGVQLRAPRKMKRLDQVLLILGTLTVIFYGVGLILIAVAVVDYYAFTKRETKFLPRP